MLEKTKLRLASMYCGQDQLGSDGQFHQLDRATRISLEQGLVLAELHKRLKPRVSIEIGMAYGFSSLFFLDAMNEGNYGHHIAIDPFQTSRWSGIGVSGLRELAFTPRFHLIEAMSVDALAKLNESGMRADYVFIDGMHTFDGALIDFYCSNRLLNVGGLIIFDDMWMPSIRKVAAFVKANFVCYDEVATGAANIFCIRKKTDDQREWNHFADF